MPSSVMIWGDVVAIDHDRRDLEIEFLCQGDAVQRLDKSRNHLLAEGLDHLNDELAPAQQARAPVIGFPARLYPGRGDVPAPVSVGAHVRCPTEAGDAAGVTVEELPSRSICNVEPMNMSQA